MHIEQNFFNYSGNPISSVLSDLNKLFISSVLMRDKSASLGTVINSASGFI